MSPSPLPTDVDHPLTSKGVDSWELSGVPYTSAKEAGGIARAIGVLRAGGLAERLNGLGVTDAGDLELEQPSGERGPSGLLNEAALGRLVSATRERVEQTHQRARLALLVGGDCPVLLGALAALRREGSDKVGLVMIDGHEDAWPPALSKTGEASDCELGIALGLVPANLPPTLDQLVPLVDPRSVALLGPRDRDEIVAAGVRTISDDLAFFLDDREVGLAGSDGDGPIAAAMQAIEADAFWLHVDLDVLSSEAFAAVDYPQPGGLRWDQLDRLALAAASDPRCRGVSIVIYNPDLDADGSGAPEVIGFTYRLVGRRPARMP